MQIRNMQVDDLEFAAQMTAAEGWVSETRQDFEGYLAYDPEGCFIAEIEDERVGICVATPYQESGFFGELIVPPSRRGTGIGSCLLDRSIQYLKERSIQNILLDGVQAARSIYEHAGFREFCFSFRFTGILTPWPTPRVRPMLPRDLEAVCALDLQGFGEDRSFFLRCRYDLYPKLAKVLEQDGRVSGFIFGKHRSSMISAGPWVVRQDTNNPEDLLSSLAEEAPGLPLSLGVLASNKPAVNLIRTLGFAERDNPPIHMLLGVSGHLGASEMCYAIGSSAKG